MKKIMIAALAMLVCGMASASQITWGNQVEIYDWLGSAIAEDSTWIMRIYESTDASIEFANLLPTGNDSWTGIEFTWASAGAPGYSGNVIFDADTTYGLAQGEYCYTVIFNNSSFGSATRWAVIDDTAATANYVGGDFSYDAGGVSAGDWQAVPEPATVGLMALGGGLAFLIRLKQRA